MTDLEGTEEEEDLRHEMRAILSADDVERLTGSLNDLRDYTLYDLIEDICLFNAVNCATELLEGGILYMEVDVNDYYLLHHAAWVVSPRLIELFLRHGARTDIRSDCRLTKKFEGLIPLNIALEAARSRSYRPMYSPGQSTFNLIVTLFCPQLKLTLEAVELLARSTRNVEEEAYHHAMEGNVIELALLLMVAHERVLGPITFDTEDSAGFNGRMTILQCLKNEIVALIFEEIKLRGKSNREKLTQIRREMMVMKSTVLLLEVFERAGDAFDEYRQVQSGQVDKYVALRLKEAGFKLKRGDIEFSIGDCIDSCDLMRTPVKYLESPSDKSYQSLSPHLPLLQQTNVVSSTRKSVNINQAPQSIFGSHYSSCIDIQVKNQTKAIEHNVAKCLSRKKFAYIAMLIKRRGIRCA